jgi:hypothetical protein
MGKFIRTEAILGCLWFAITAGATSVPRFTFEELTDRSEVIATGQIQRSWSDWDSSHHFIWTHYEMGVDKLFKGGRATTIVLSEPGGLVGGMGQTIAGSVRYQTGDKVFVFLERVPNGYLRTAGWSQGKYAIDASGRLHAEASRAGVEMVDTPSASAATLSSLEGVSVAELGARVTARLRSQGRAQ